MREIKFRACDGYNETMVLAWHPRFKVDGETTSILPSDELMQVMQYTGLKDKHGKEIYEGDIVGHFVKDMDGNEFESFRSEIKWWPDMVNVEKAVVIGNIYENPDLLK